MTAQTLASLAVLGAAASSGFIATGYALRRRRLPTWAEVMSVLSLTAFAGAHMLGLIWR